MVDDSILMLDNQGKNSMGDLKLGEFNFLSEISSMLYGWPPHFQKNMKHWNSMGKSEISVTWLREINIQ